MVNLIFSKIISLLIVLKNINLINILDFYLIYQGYGLNLLLFQVFAYFLFISIYLIIHLQ